MALIKTFEEFQKWVKVNSTTKLDAYLGDIWLVEDKQIRKYLGPAFYKEFEKKYQDNALTELQKELLVFLQMAVANLAQESYLTINQVSISPAGVQIKSDTTNKTAFQWQIEDLEVSFLEKGFNGLERALEFLEDNIAHADFKTWKDSPASTVFHQYFINNSQEFSAEYNIQDSRLVYLNLLPIIKKMEGFAIEPVLGADLFLEVKDQIKGRSVTEENKYLLQEFIRPALAHLVAAKALVEEAFAITPDGLELKFARKDNSNGKESEAGNDAMLDRKIKAAYQDGQAYLVKLKDYLNAQASETKFKKYFESDLYVAGNTEPVVYKNPTDARIFSFI